MPTLPGWLQVSHWPEQLLSQHTPSTQLNVAHCAPRVQGPPVGVRGTHAPASQKLVDTQSTSVAHDSGQVAAPRQTKGAQLGLPCTPERVTTQVPAAVQVSHGPLHALSQQRPSEHEPVEHWLAALHAAPRGS